MITLFDTHAHLDDEQLFGDLDDVVGRATASGLVGIIAIATSADSAERCVQIANRFENVYASVGIQPNYVAEASEEDWQRIEALVDSPQVKAIGETGLDHYWDFAPLAIQREYFVRHIQLARRRQLPLVIHMRDPQALDPQQNERQPCGRDILRHLREQSGGEPIQGIMHSYSSNANLAQECLAIGLHISFAGMVTYKKAHALREVAATIPLERMLIETDAPYLSPHPVRGQRPNEPALVMHTAKCLAEVFGIGVEEFGRLTTQNARRLFSV
jgi:TatD DNase family protein